MAKSKLRHGNGRGKPRPVDIHVGARVRQCRTLLGMTQTMLADGLDLTFQQVQKYERGTNRISASRLYDLSRVLDVPVEYFFDEMPKEIASKSGAGSSSAAAGAEEFDPDIVSKRETLEMVRAYYKIEDANARKRLYGLIKVLGANGA